MLSNSVALILRQTFIKEISLDIPAKHLNSITWTGLQAGRLNSLKHGRLKTGPSFSIWQQHLITDRALATRNTPATHLLHLRVYSIHHHLLSLTEKPFQNGLPTLDCLVSLLLAMFSGSMMALVQSFKNYKQWVHSIIRLFFFLMTTALKVEKALSTREAFDP